MNDEIALVQLAKIDLSAIAAELLGPLETATAMRRVTAEQLRARQDDQFSVRKNETARQSSFKKLDVGDRVAHDFAEPLDLAFRLKIDDDPKVGGSPVPQACGELCALRFDQHEIADREVADVATIERAAKIFRLISA